MNTDNHDGEKTDTGFSKEFLECPACHSTKRFFETMTKELKERGLAGEDFNFRLDAKRGVVADPKRQASILIGTSLPAFEFATDICENCGTIYVVKLQRLTAHQTLTPVDRLPPNRADRRRFEQGRN